MSNQRIPLQKLGHVAYRVQDPAASSAYYQKVLGLQETYNDGKTIALTSAGLYADQNPVEFVLTQGNETALDYIAFEVNGQDELEATKRILSERGQAFAEVAACDIHNAAIVVTGPMDYKLMITTTRRDPELKYIAPWPYRITKLGHITLQNPDPTAFMNYMTQTLDFRLSEQMSDKFYWMRCNVDHHTVGCAFSPRIGVNHVAFELASWEDVMRFNDHLRDHNVRIEYGPGRHGPGNNIFIYFIDPNGIRFELFTDMHKIYNEQDYVPKVWDASMRLHNVNQWGPQPPASFLE